MSEYSQIKVYDEDKGKNVVIRVVGTYKEDGHTIYRLADNTTIKVKDSERTLTNKGVR